MNKNRNLTLQSVGGINGLKKRYPQLNEKLIRNIAATFPVSGNIVINLKSLNKELNKHRGLASIPGVRSQGVHKRPTRRRGVQRPQRRAITPNQLANMMNLIRLVPPKNKSLENVMRGLRIRR